VQLHRIERLYEEVVATRFDAPQAVGAIGLRRHDHDGHEARRALFLQFAADLDPMPAGGKEVDEDEIGRVDGAHFEHAFSRLHDGHVMAFAGQQPLEKAGAGLVVVGHEDRSPSNHFCH
jgi:hypothetical protein